MFWRLMLAGLAAAAMAGPANATCRVHKYAELPVTMVGTQPRVPVKINGASVMMVADSGAFHSSISPATAAELKLNRTVVPGLYITGVGGVGQAFTTRVRDFGLANATIHNVEFLVGGGAGDGAVGLLGQNVLNVVGDVEFDLASGVIRLIKTEGCEQTDLAYWAGDKPYAVLQLEATDGDHPHIVATIKVNGVPVRALFDTGASTSVMSLSAARRAGLKTDSPGVVAAGFSSGVGDHAVPVWIAPIASIELGGETVTNARVRIADLGETAEMLIGSDFFLSHRIYVAGAQRQLYMTYDGGPLFDLSAPTKLTQIAASSDARPVPANASPEPKTADDFGRRGAALLARGQYDAAVADLTRAIDLAPKDPRYLRERAGARFAAKRPDLASADIDAALKLDPADRSTRLLRARARLASRQLDGAREDLDAVARDLSRQADERLTLGHLYLEANLPGPAIEQLSTWIATHDGDGRMAMAMNSRCWARGLAGRELDQALSDCNTAQRLGLKSAETLDSRALVRLRRGEYERAIADYNEALRAKPKSAWSLYGRGLAKLKKGLSAEGEADLRAAAGIDPHLPERAKALGVS